MPVKTHPPETLRIVSGYREVNGSRSESRSNLQQGSESISYSDGKRLPSGRWPWKQCHHEFTSRWTNNGIAGTSICEMYRANRNTTIRYGGNCFFPGRYTPELPRRYDTGFDNGALAGILSQLDLNKGESVLLYSGILQAVPLVGSVFKLNRILKDAYQRLKKDLRKKPFTTVVKQMISLDFIDRFVISPTIDDARRFAAATDYVINTVNTAMARNASRFALSSEITTTYSADETSWSNYNLSGNAGTFAGTQISRSYETSKAFALLEAKYSLDSATPIKLWMRRVGLTRPLESAWDLVPFSFVIDYFTRAGDFIAALSDEMSDVDGLKGTITRIHDLWGTHTSVSSITRRATAVRMQSLPSQFVWTIPPTCNEQSTTYKSGTFDRFRIVNPWGALLSQQEKVGDYLTVNLDLSSTRKRTIAELIIQAKL